MIRSLLRKVFYAIVVLWILSVIIFWLSKQMPGDEVLDYVSIDDTRYAALINPLDQRTSYGQVARERGFYFPGFYFSVSPSLFPDSVDLILNRDEKVNVKNWITVYKQPERVLGFYHLLLQGMRSSCSSVQTGSPGFQSCLFYAQSLATHDPEIIYTNAVAVSGQINTDSSVTASIREDLSSLIMMMEDLKKNKPSGLAISSWMPTIRWHGTQNQYHQWMRGLLLQQPLTSLIDGRNAWKKIYEALSWTLLLNGLSLLLALAAGIRIGIWSGKHHGRGSEKSINWILFALFAIPSFWLATLLIYFFASGEVIKVFPAGGIGDQRGDAGIFSTVGNLFMHLFLPVICLAAGALAYVSRQMKESFLHEAKQPYALALKAHGVSKKTIHRFHVIPNALFPIITIIGGSVPALLSGSLIIEVIFNIPGMGRLMYSSLLARDWPVAFPLLMMAAFVTVVSYILTDLIYKWADPRVKTVEG